jgi:ribosomal protein S18 acetylase RimI-like enzyme/nitroimidazol reductase NimA-like FMN-containing flavoprotein (pyridoxamine 5'-phosphate oxidase superfamily)
MRRERFFRMDAGEALAFLEAAPVVHLASTTPDGLPLVRTLHTVIVDGALSFHAAPVGEKHEALGRPVVISAEEIVATVPSYFSDPERACPATTLYRSVQVHGTLAAIEAPFEKARVLQALMKKYQPEGGHVPIDAAHPQYDALYDKQVAALWIGRVALDRVDGKSKLAQNRSPAERAQLCARLWQRGLDGDVRAIELVRAANPDMPTPPFLQLEPALEKVEPAFENSNGGSPARVTLHCALGPGDVEPALALLRDAYWNAGQHPPARIAGALLGASAWVGARDGDGRLIACARAVSDGHKCAWIYDVVVAPAWRRRGLASAMMRLLLDHPRVRHAATVRLQTMDAQPLYRKLGFVELSEVPPPPFDRTDMLRVLR